MSIFGQYQTPLGYKISENGIDTYGVNHTKFSIQDELNYQFARDKREKQIIAELNKQGITENYPQYGTNFWNRPSDNNFGFGEDNVQENIEKKAIHEMQKGTIADSFDLLNMKEGMQSLLHAINTYKQLFSQPINDKYKHSVISCIASQGGNLPFLAMGGLGITKEFIDIIKKFSNPNKYGNYQQILQDSQQDLQADWTGLIQGYFNPNTDCEKLIKYFYDPTIK